MNSALRPSHPFIWLAIVLAAGCVETPPADPRPIAQDQTLVLTQSGAEMALIHGGEFTMGDATAGADAKPHTVRVGSFYVDCRPISQSIYRRITDHNPSKRKSDSAPVERVQWTDAAKFCNLCSEAEGLQPCYDLETWECDFAADGYRLPTEAEWEYACRAGSDAQYFFGNDERELVKYAWFKPHSQGRTQAVGKKLPNDWGLYDMLGNVWEWCNDYYDPEYYAESPADNPRGPAEGKLRVLRGGAWNVPADRCRPAVRFSEFQVFTDACFGADSYGFRRVRRASPAASSPAAAAEIAAVAAEPAERPAADTVSAAKATLPSRAEPVESPAALIQRSSIETSRLSGQIAFVSDRAGSLDIWSMSANGEQLRPLTSDAAADADPRFSPAGDTIMFTTLREGFPEICTIDTEGSNRRRITDGSQASWAPDGESIVFIRDDQAFVRHLGSGVERRVTPVDWRRCGVPAWSPDGNQLAVASRHLERIGIFLFSLDGAQHRQLQTEDACCTPQWSNDGTMIVFQTDKGHIHLHYTDDGTEEQVTFGADVQHDARFSPDGSFIVYSRASSEDGPWQLWIADLESDDLESLQITSEGSNRLPDWR